MSKTIYTLSFIQDENYYEDHLALDQAEHEQLWRRLNAARDALPYGEKVQDLQLFTPGETRGSATHLVDTIASALSRNLETLDEQAKAGNKLDPEDQELLTLFHQAGELDQAEDRSDRVAFGFDFVWDNGGGDDNAFSQGFTVAPEQQQAAWTLVEALAEWIEGNGHGYETNPGIQGDLTPCSLEEGLTYLAEEMDQIGADSWAKALREAIVPEPATPAVTPSAPGRARPRPR